MTKDELKEIRERCAKATPGSWHTNHNYAYQGGLRVFGDDGNVTVASGLYIEDARFISHAREDIPKLLEEVERLNGVLKDIANAEWRSDAIGIARKALGVPKCTSV